MKPQEEFLQGVAEALASTRSCLAEGKRDYGPQAAVA